MFKHLSRRLFVALVFAGGMVASIASPPGEGARSQEDPISGRSLGALINDLSAPEPGIRAAAAKALGRIGPAAMPAAAALADALRDKNGSVRYEAADALGRIGPAAMPAVIGVLHSDLDLLMRAAAAEALTRIGPATIPVLIEVLRGDPESGVRWAAVRALKLIGPAAAAATPVLVDVLRGDPESGVRREAAEALSRIGPAAEVVPALVEALRTERQPWVRERLPYALGEIGPAAAGAVPALVDVLRGDPESDVRWGAAWNLGRIGPAAGVVPALIEALRTERQPGVREAAADALGRIGPAAATALIEVLRGDPESGVRHEAAEALGEIGPDAAAAVPALIDALRDKNNSVRAAAANALGRIGPDAAAAVPALVETLRGAPEPEMYEAAAFALGGIGPDAAAAVPALIDVLRIHPESGVRWAVADALGRIGPAAAAAVPALVEALRGAPEPEMHVAVAEALGGIGPAAAVAVPDLVAALEDPSVGIIWAAATALAKIATALQDAGATSSLTELRQARDALMALPEDAKGEGTEQDITTVRRAVADLERQRRLQWVAVAERATGFARAHPYAAAAIAAYPLLAFVLLLLFWLRPLALLRINDALKPYTDFALPASLGGVKIPLRYLLLVGLFHHRPWVLDARVKAHVAPVRKRFAERDTVRAREIHIDVPIILDGRAGVELNGGRLRPAFAGRIACLLIQGEGGAGKTSLACRIAQWAMADDPAERPCRHRMLPVLIEQELHVAVLGGRDPLREAVGRQLQELADEPDPIAPDLLERLLRHRRVLVIIDHLSEMSVETRAKIRPEAPDFPANALIVTSRLEEPLGGVSRTVIQPPRLDGNGVSYFLETYLIRRGARALFDLEEYFEGCRRLAAMVGDRAITVLLAKLYAEQMIATKQGGGSERDLPDTIPDLMVGYLNELNRGIPEADKLGDRIVHSNAKALAWECLAETYRPSSARIEDALAALGGEDAEARLRYLEYRLRLVRTVPPAKDRIQFLLDPLAEYLAGLNRVEEHGANEEKWRQFLAEADGKEGAPEAIRGFLLAVRDCCLAKEAGVPASVERELAERARLDLKALERARLEQRVRRLIANLSLPDASDRRLAAEALGEIGPAAAVAVPVLAETLRNDPNKWVRWEAAMALGRIDRRGLVAVSALIEALHDDQEDELVRAVATSALGSIRPAAAAAVSALAEILRTDSEPGVRVSAAKALSWSGSKAVPALVEALRTDSEPNVRVAAAEALGQIELDTVAIRALAETLHDDQDERVREAAAEVLEHLAAS